jgi:hypothetical protein
MHLPPRQVLHNFEALRIRKDGGAGPRRGGGGGAKAREPSDLDPDEEGLVPWVS